MLVEGDDHNEPIADAVRSILDGHVVLDRAIAERGRYPAINILKSVSRSLPGCNAPEENALIGRARRLLAVYEDMAELIRLGAYRKGTDPEVDEAIRLYPRLEAFLAQGKDERSTLAEAYAALAEILSGARRRHEARTCRRQSSGAMADKLLTLIRLHTWRLDEQRRTLAEALRELDRLQRQSRALEGEIAAEQGSPPPPRPRSASPTPASPAPRCERRASCREAIVAAEAEVATQRDKLAEPLP